MKRCISFILSLGLLLGLCLPLLVTDAAAEIALPEGFTLCAENSHLALYLKEDDGNVAVVSKTSGNVSYAFPTDVATDLLAAGITIDQLQSMIRLSYSNVSGAINEMDSHYDCVSADQLSWEQTENGLTLKFLLGDKQGRLPVPMVISVREFNAVLRALEADTTATDRLKYFYTYVNLEKIEDEYERETWLEEYPGLKKSDMFICDELSEEERLELAGYYQKAGFTLEKLDEQYDQLSYEEEVEASPWFEMELRFTLENDRLTVALPKDSIRYDSKNFSLYKITILPYFNAVKEKSGGYIFIPDQSGRQLVADGRIYSSQSMTGKIYGRDYANADDDSSTIRFNLPIYVTKNGNTAVLTEIVSGEASATITAEAAGFSHSYFAAYSTFTWQNKVYFGASGGGDSSFTMFEKQSTNPDFKLQYTFVSENNGDIYTVADVYRSSLLDREKKQENDIPLFLSTLGSIDTELDILFFTFRIHNTLTSFADNQTIIEKLNAAGISNIAMELQGIANGGLNNTAFSNFKVMGNLGGKKGLQELITYAKGQNAAVFPSVDLSFVKRLTVFDGYQAKKNGNRTVEGKSAVLQRFGLASGQETEDALLTVNSFTAKKYFDKILRTLLPYGLNGLSLGQLGNTVNSDFAKSAPINRNTQVADYQSILSAVEAPVMVAGANAYTIPTADYFAEIPYSNTPVYNFGDKVLFLQAVLHGYADYSIEKLNFAEDLDTAVLRCIEAGASPDFTVLYRNAQKLRKDSYYSGYYSADFTFWLDKIVDAYERVNGILKQVSSATITGYQTLAEGITATWYSNGKTVLVNYTASDYIYHGTTVNAQQAIILEGRS